MPSMQIRDRLTHLLLPIKAAYRRVCSIDEIENQTILQWMFGGILLFFFLTFGSWIGATQATIQAAESGVALCWPFFQNCADYYFLEALPYGYSQNIFYMCLYGIMLAIVYAMWRKKWELAHLLLFTLLIWEILTVLFVYREAAPYYYYHITLTSILLFARHKEYFLKLAFVVMYFLSATVKLNDGWVLGTYFTSLELGLPIFPDIFAPLLTNFVIFTQIVGAWFLLSRNAYLKNLVLAELIFFHLYSGAFVHYNYPTVAIVPLIILFGPLSRHTPTPFKRDTWFGWLVIMILLICQLVGFAAPGDRRMTLENNRWGMYMFEANHQCFADMTIHSEGSRETFDWEAAKGTPCNGFYCLVKQSVSSTGTSTAETRRYESGSAWNRCAPYEWWSRIHSFCERDTSVQRVEFRLSHSINGGPFYRTVDLPNICDVDFLPFVHNEWIKVPPEALVDGYPVMNSYHY